MEGKRILVTGGAGFIGSHIIDELLKPEYKVASVTAVDNLLTGKEENLQHIRDSRFKFIKGDVRLALMSDMLCKDIDLICHQAALGSVPRSIERPIYTYHFNVMSFLTLCESARKMGIKRIVYASSSSVYGDDTRLPKKENLIGNPLSPYATSKLNNEQVAHVYNTIHGLECIGLRYFNVFGPRQDPKGAYAAVIPKFIDQIKKGKQCVIYGNGSNSRDFTYVSNVVQANILALTADYQSLSSNNKVYNIAAGNRTSVNELYSKISEIIKNKNDVSEFPIINPKYDEPRLGDVAHSYADISLATEDLAYHPFVSIDEGLEKTV